MSKSEGDAKRKPSELSFQNLDFSRTKLLHSKITILPAHLKSVTAALLTLSFKRKHSSVHEEVSSKIKFSHRW
jgi:hypothetical protein